MLLLTAEQARQADRMAIEGRGIPARTLMENAGRGAFEILRKYVPDLRSKKIAVVCGRGNNGGDGRVLAGLLQDAVRSVRVLDSDSFSPSAIQDADIVVDALFGTGLSREVQGPVKAIIEEINRSGRWVLALDVPSGLSTDTGRPLGVAVRANLTVTMGLPKIGLVLPEAAPYVGKLEVVDIGIPQEVYASFQVCHHWTTAADIRPLFKPRDPDTHKGTYGHVLFVGGSETKPGSILLAGRSALRTGAGLATVALPDKAFRKFPKNFLELMYEPVPSHRSGTLARRALARILKLCEGKGAIAVGPGMGVNADTKAIVVGLVKKGNAPMVLDADALNCIRGSPLPKNIILTPHPGEMARLTGISTTTIQKNRMGIARDFAASRKVFLVLKGFRTLVVTPEGEIFVNSTGNPGMATAGMGDVLTGAIASLLAQGLSPREAALAGVWLHGRAGDRVAERLGDRGLLATDVVDEIPQTIQELLK